MRSWVMGLLAAAVCVLGAASCTSEAASGLSERDSREALAVLSEAGVGATREHAGGEGAKSVYKIVVPARDAGRAAEVLRAQGLPRAAERGLAETYSGSSMIPSATEEHARWLKALAGEIAAQLERFDAVVDASVIVSAPLVDPLAPADAPRGKPSASVLLELRAGAAAPAEADVKRLVAAAVDGLDEGAVAVVSETRAAAPAPVAAFDSLLGIHVARGSKGALVGVLAAALALVIAMGGWVVLGARRRA